VNDTVIEVESVSKRYRLGVIGTGTLSEDLNRWWARMRGRPDPTLKIGQTAIGKGTGPRDGVNALSDPGSDPGFEESEHVWALRDLSFEVGSGEVLGIIGRNGAGKSTILKILSRVTAPTAGEVRVKGRIASLLEVGTGFHPELTGRENIFLNGAILGMRKADIERRLDEIVAFSEVEQYIDTPVKRYSSGMYVRLAFAVAAHLDPEILIVDEVLAVGDATFQKKCLGKMGSFAGEGRTVLFVSHNMPAVNRLCTRAILLGNGTLLEDGDVGDVTTHYLQSDLSAPPEKRWADEESAPQSRALRLIGVRIRDRQGLTRERVDIREEVGVEIEYEVLEPAALTPSIHVYDAQDAYVFEANDSYNPEWAERARAVGVWKSTCWIPGNLLHEGTYMLNITFKTAATAHKHFAANRVVSLNVFEGPGGPTARGAFAGRLGGTVRPLLEWTGEHQP
jgi:lipopolysaccharide transport system ATP-binding protein